MVRLILFVIEDTFFMITFPCLSIHYVEWCSMMTPQTSVTSLVACEAKFDLLSQMILIGKYELLVITLQLIKGIGLGISNDFFKYVCRNICAGRCQVLVFSSNHCSFSIFFHSQIVFVVRALVLLFMRYNTVPLEGMCVPSICFGKILSLPWPFLHIFPQDEWKLLEI